MGLIKRVIAGLIKKKLGVRLTVHDLQISECKGANDEEMVSIKLHITAPTNDILDCLRKEGII